MAVDLATKDWRYNWYSGTGGAFWAVYMWYKGGSQWQAFVRFLAGMGVGGTVAYVHNEWL